MILICDRYETHNNMSLEQMDTNNHANCQSQASEEDSQHNNTPGTSPSDPTPYSPAQSPSLHKKAPNETVLQTSEVSGARSSSHSAQEYTLKENDPVRGIDGQAANDNDDSMQQHPNTDGTLPTSGRKTSSDRAERATHRVAPSQRYDTYPSGYCADSHYVGRSPMLSRFPVYSNRPASYSLHHDLYLPQHSHGQDLFSHNLSKSTSKNGGNSTTMAVDLTKLDLNLTLGVEGKPYSYAQLITYAIAHSPSGKLTLSEIYDWCLENFPYFSKQTNQGWKNSIRHNLSLNKTFVKVPRPVNEPGKGAYWALDGQSLVSGPVTTSQSRNRQRPSSTAESPARTGASGPTARRHRTDSGSSRNQESSFANQTDHRWPPAPSMTQQTHTRQPSHSSQQKFEHNEMYYQPESHFGMPSSSISMASTRIVSNQFTGPTAYPNFPLGPVGVLQAQPRNSAERFELPSLKRDFSAPSGFAPMVYPAPSSHLSTYGLSPPRQASFDARDSKWLQTTPRQIPSQMNPGHELVQVPKDYELASQQGMWREMDQVGPSGLLRRA